MLLFTPPALNGIFAQGINLSQSFNYSRFSTHRSGKLALTVTHANPVSQSAWSASVQGWSAGQCATICSEKLPDAVVTS